MESIIEIVIRIFLCKFDHFWHEWVSALGEVQIKKSLTVPPVNEVEIIYKSQNFLVINKRHDIVINSDDPSVKISLQIQLKELFPDLVNPNLQHDFYFVHRLDYATSGVICIALHKKACAAATQAFSERKTKKYYLALLRGHVACERMDMHKAIGEDSQQRCGNHRMCTLSDPHCVYPRSAHTRLLVLQRGLYDFYPATKVLLRPITGRRHQLRVHCADIGHTIVGDYTYSNRRDVLPHRMFLHAFRLVLANDVEPLCLQTHDPFSSDVTANKWTPVETLNHIDSASFSKLDMEGDS
ncbi:RNA pseudouridylate synthase domain-containing protein 1-like [Periplaneta americana]|uniref:RNA pseudouridylate synthase domain-containing protein 1-like n=1 Tax=Periplaneta americana TaxID=6978 RepID=UPI0037E7334A